MITSLVTATCNKDLRCTRLNVIKKANDLLLSRSARCVNSRSERAPGFHGSALQLLVADREIAERAHPRDEHHSGSSFPKLIEVLTSTRALRASNRSALDARSDTSVRRKWTIRYETSGAFEGTETHAYGISTSVGAIRGTRGT